MRATRTQVHPESLSAQRQAQFVSSKYTDAMCESAQPGLHSAVRTVDVAFQVSLLVERRAHVGSFTGVKARSRGDESDLDDSAPGFPSRSLEIVLSMTLLIAAVDL
jgi:hypothetical protein